MAKVGRLLHRNVPLRNSGRNMHLPSSISYGHGQSSQLIMEIGPGECLAVTRPFARAVEAEAPVC